MGYSATISSTSSSTSVLSGLASVLGAEVEQVDGLGLLLAVAAHVFEQDARRVVPQQEPLQFHLNIDYNSELEECHSGDSIDCVGACFCEAGRSACSPITSIVCDFWCSQSVLRWGSSGSTNNRSYRRLSFLLLLIDLISSSSRIWLRCRGKYGP